MRDCLHPVTAALTPPGAAPWFPAIGRRSSWGLPWSGRCCSWSGATCEFHSGWSGRQGLSTCLPRAGTTQCSPGCLRWPGGWCCSTSCQTLCRLPRQHRRYTSRRSSPRWAHCRSRSAACWPGSSRYWCISCLLRRRGKPSEFLSDWSKCPAMRKCRSLEAAASRPPLIVPHRCCDRKWMSAKMTARRVSWTPAAGHACWFESRWDSRFSDRQSWTYRCPLCEWTPHRRCSTWVHLFVLSNLVDARRRSHSLVARHRWHRWVRHNSGSGSVGRSWEHSCLGSRPRWTECFHCWPLECFQSLEWAAGRRSRAGTSSRRRPSRWMSCQTCDEGSRGEWVARNMDWCAYLGIPMRQMFMLCKFCSLKNSK